MAAKPSPPSEFVRAITRLDATALVVGSMIGSGIFIVSADIARQVESPGLLLLVWVLAGVVTLMGALTYGELAAQFPKAGGQYVYLREAISPLFGFLYGWTLFMVIQTGTIAAVAVGFARFMSVLVPQLSAQQMIGFTVALPSGPIDVGLSPQRLLAIASIFVLTWINVRGVRVAALVQTLLTSVKVLSLLALILLGLTIGRSGDAAVANFGAAFWPEGGIGLGTLPLLGAAMVGALFAMDAWNNVGFAADELQKPSRDLPFAMLTGVVIVTVLYVSANVAYLSVLDIDSIAHAPEDRVATAVLQAIFGAPGMYVMAAAIVDFDDRLQQRADPLGRARVLRDGARRTVLQKRRGAASDAQDAGVRAVRAGGVGERAVRVRNVQSAARLRGVRGIDVLSADRDRPVRAAAQTSGRGAAGGGTGVSGGCRPPMRC